MASAQTRPSGYDADRLTTERMEQLVERPMGLVREGDVDDAERMVRQLIATIHARNGAGSIEEADLLMAFGATLHGEGDYSGKANLRALAAGYVERSVEAYRAAFGPDHPEVATALNSHADVLRLANPDDPPALAERLLEETYRIRRAALGPTHNETLWTVLYLADVRAAPARVRQQPALVDSVTAELERVAELALTGDPETAADIPLHAQLRRARLFARNGRTQEADRALTAAGQVGGMDALERCAVIALEMPEIEDLLSKAGAAPLPQARDWTECLELLPEAHPPQRAIATVLSSV